MVIFIWFFLPLPVVSRHKLINKIYSLSTTLYIVECSKNKPLFAGVVFAVSLLVSRLINSDCGQLILSSGLLACHRGYDFFVYPFMGDLLSDDIPLYHGCASRGGAGGLIKVIVHVWLSFAIIAY